MNDADIIHLLKQRLVGKQIGKIIYSKSPSTNYNSNFNFSDFEKDIV